MAPRNTAPAGTQILPMTVSHVPDVIRLWEATEGLILTPTDNVADLGRYFEHNPGLSLVAVRDELIVGAVLCGHDGRRGYLHHLAVAAEMRNRGIGRTLVRNCLERLRQAGIRQCNLFVVDAHEEGRTFWSRDGWHEWPDIRLMSKVFGAVERT